MYPFSPNIFFLMKPFWSCATNHWRDNTNFCLAGVKVYWASLKKGQARSSSDKSSGLGLEMHVCGSLLSLLWGVKPHAMGIFMDASPHKHDQLTPFLVPLPSLEKWEWDWNFQDSNHVLVIVVTTPIQESSRSPPSHLIRTKDTPITQEIMRDLAA